MDPNYMYFLVNLKEFVEYFFDILDKYSFEVHTKFMKNIIPFMW